jgi:hypothetical protein
LMAKIFSLGDSLKSRLKNGVTGSLNINWPIVGRVGDSEHQGFPFLIVRLGDKYLLCTSAGLAERAMCDRTWEVRPVLPPSGLASWDARVRARDPWHGEFWLDPTLEPPASAFEDAPPGVLGADILEKLLGWSPPMVC